MKKEISENANITANSKQIDVLKEHFPNCFDKDGAFQPHKLEELVKASGSDITREGYTLNWLGKSYARLLANENVRTLLAANEEHNSKPENANSENLLIQGDNLEVLKHLKNAYREKVKMIYIDPPYNTGSDGFVYADDRKFTVEQLSQLAGIEDDEAKRILEFTQSKSNSHSAWLTFMFPRLYIARELLREDGVIFISIDDNEQAQLKLLCDEVFGEENFVGHLMWKRRVSSALDESNLSTDHEGVICYKKSEFEGFRGIAKNFKNYKNPDNDPRGDWISDNLTVGMSAAMRPNQAYDLLDPETGISYPHNPNRVWAFIPETMDRMILEGRILFPSDNSKRPMQKRFKGELKTQFNPYSTLMMNHVGLNSEATKAMQSLLTGNIFEYSKPLSLLHTLTLQVTETSDLTLDFFSGSGTTAHAVMALNSEDGGNRKCISVQLDEPTDPKSEAYKVGYNTIFEITRERIKRAATKIKEENPEAKCDFGFKEFKTISPFDGYLDEAETLEQYEAFEAEKLSEEERRQLMLTWQVYDGLPLHLELTSIQLAGYVAHQGNELLYFMDQGLELKHIVELLERIDHDKDFAPRKLIILGQLLTSKAQREISEAIHSYNNRKGIELTLDIRF